MSGDAQETSLAGETGWKNPNPPTNEEVGVA